MLTTRTSRAKTRKRSVLMVGSEAHPFSKTGGLADVLGALPAALGHLGWQTTLVIPKYQGVRAGRLTSRLRLKIGARLIDAAFYSVRVSERVKVVLVDVPELYDREGIYGIGTTDYADSPRRFATLARAALEFVAQTDRRVDVVHAHDWQGGLVPVYLRTLYASHPVLGGTPSVMTIHNLAYQGVFERDWLPRLDLPWDLFTQERMEFWGRISLLKGGINDAHAITTVSPTYAREIQTPEFGFGFEGVLRRRAADISGILNGIDTTAWDPSNDPALPAPYDATRLEKKKASKREVLSRYGLPVDAGAQARPLIGMISRMVDQKGLDLLAAGAETLPRLDASFVVLGTGEERYQEFWRQLAQQHPARIGVRIGFDESLAHLIEAGADMFLMPSRFEPCGLNQMYSLRYGTVPIVRGVGGLADTVKDGQTGFVFADYSTAAMLETLGRALTAFRKPAVWRAIQVAGMAEDHSWDRSASEYVKIYERLAGAGG